MIKYLEYSDKEKADKLYGTNDRKKEVIRYLFDCWDMQRYTDAFQRKIPLKKAYEFIQEILIQDEFKKINTVNYFRKK